MQYEGKLYGKIGRKYIPLSMSSSDVDGLRRKVEALEQLISDNGLDGRHALVECDYCANDRHFGCNGSCLFKLDESKIDEILGGGE